MAKINLREHYPDHYNTDYIIEVPDEVADLMQEFNRYEAAYRRRVYYHKAQYSLDRCDGIEYDAVFRAVTPWEVYERKLTMEQLHAAIASLPDKQAKRIHAHFFLDLTIQEIARSEKVSSQAVNQSILHGLRRLEKFMKKIL